MARGALVDAASVPFGPELPMSVLSMAERAKVAACLVDGTSIRATERITSTHRDTVMRFGLALGEGCARLHDKLVRGVNCRLLQSRFTCSGTTTARFTALSERRPPWPRG